MIFSVPQFIDIEDKVVGPLTARQFGWIALGSIILLITYKFVDQSTFILVAIILAVIFGSLAFYRPYNKPLFNVVLSAVSFIFKPKIYTWHRITEKLAEKGKRDNSIPNIIPRKKLNLEEVAQISKALDLKKK